MTGMVTSLAMGCPFFRAGEKRHFVTESVILASTPGSVRITGVISVTVPSIPTDIFVRTVSGVTTVSGITTGRAFSKRGVVSALLGPADLGFKITEYQNRASTDLPARLAGLNFKSRRASETAIPKFCWSAV